MGAAGELGQRRLVRQVALAIIFLGVVVVAVWGLRGRGATARPAPPPSDPVSVSDAPVKPRLPPKPGAPHVRLPTPEMPPDVATIAAAAYAGATTRPGEAAFRATVRAFIAYNARFAEVQAAKEGITIGEVEELTYLGFLVQATQRLDDVAELTGRTYSDAERAQIGALMGAHNDAFKASMRAAVARGAGETERWQLIRDTEAGYLDDFRAATGLDDDQLDGLLAGDLAKPGAPIATEIPAQIEPRAYVVDPARPAAPR